MSAPNSTRGPTTTDAFDVDIVTDTTSNNVHWKDNIVHEDILGAKSCNGWFRIILLSYSVCALARIWSNSPWRRCDNLRTFQIKNKLRYFQGLYFEYGEFHGVARLFVNSKIMFFVKIGFSALSSSHLFIHLQLTYKTQNFGQIPNSSLKVSYIIQKSWAISEIRLNEENSRAQTNFIVRIPYIEELSEDTICGTLQPCR